MYTHEFFDLPENCPKCGMRNGFLYAKPKYHKKYREDRWDFDCPDGEHLDFTCETCDYMIQRLTHDNYSLTQTGPHSPGSGHTEVKTPL